MITRPAEKKFRSLDACPLDIAGLEVEKFRRLLFF